MSFFFNKIEQNNFSNRLEDVILEKKKECCKKYKKKGEFCKKCPKK